MHRCCEQVAGTEVNIVVGNSFSDYNYCLGFEVESFRENGKCLEIADGNSVGIVEGKCVEKKRGEKKNWE